MKNIDIVDIDNNKLGEILIFELDSVDSVISRISRLLSIPPKFLYVTNEITLNSSLEKIQILDIYTLLKTKISFFDSIITLFENNYFKTQDSFLSFKLFIKVFTINNKELLNALEKELAQQNEEFYAENMYTVSILSKIYCDIFRSLFLLDLKNLLYSKELKNILLELKLHITNTDITSKDICKNFENNNIIIKIFQNKLDINLLDTLKNRNYQQTLINDEIQENNIKDEKCFEKFRNFDNEKGVPYTEFELEQIDFSINMKITNQKDVPILSMFNSVIMNKYTVFSTTNSYFKVLRDFIPLSSWTYYADVLKDSLLLKIYNKKDQKSNDAISDDNYTSVIITPTIEDGNTFVKVDFVLFNKGNFVSKTEILERIFQSFINIDFEILDEKINNINGYYFLPSNSIHNVYVMYDFIINDERFSNLLNFNEKKATKDRSSLYVKFFHETSGDIKIDITDMIFTKETQIPNCISSVEDDKNADLALKKLSNGSVYLRVNIRKSKSLESILYFKNIFSKLMSIYEKEFDYVQKIYTDLIPIFPSFVTITEARKMNLKTVKRLKLKDLLPDIFKSKYSKRCEPSRQPQITDDENLKGENVLLFPKKKGEDDKTPQCAYLCKDIKFPYAGVIVNKDVNKDIYPFLPCCFEASQQGKEGSKLKQYLFDIEKKNKKIPSGVIITDKYVFDGTRGKLPSSINKIFQINIQNVLNHNYYRKGMLYSKNSFLQCVLEALSSLNEECKNFNNITDSLEKINALIKIRKDLANDEFIVACKQEMYDYSIGEIKEKILNTESYFDPVLFIHLLEIRFKCNIYLFTRNEKNPNGTILLPRFKKIYYKSNNTFPNVLIYTHLGSDLDNKDFPMCELIISESKNENLTRVRNYFKHDSDESEGFKKIFSKMLESYKITLESSRRNNQLIRNIYYNFLQNEPEIYKPIAQVIDMYGKTRMIIFKTQDEDEDGEGLFSLFTEPLQPSNLPIYNTNTFYKVSAKTVLNIINVLNIKNISQVIDDNEIVKEISGKIGDINIKIPIKNTKKIPNIPETKQVVSYFKYSSSLINIYDTNKKYAKYLSEYVIWLYSIFVKDRNIKDIFKDENILDFFDENIEIIENYKYEDNIIPLYFTKDCCLFFNGKLIIESQDIKNKLIFVLVLKMIRYRDNFLKYFEKINIPDYFESESDFKNKEDEIILKGKNLIEQRNFNIENIVNIQDTFHVEEEKLDIKKYLEEYIVWLYSAYASKNNIQDEDIYKEEVVSQFFDENTRIDKYYKYDTLIPREFTTDCCLFSDGKLVLNTINIKNKLMDYLIKEVSNDIEEFREYHTKTDIPQQEKDEPIYFFKNRLIDNYIYLAQNTDTIEKALKIGYIWHMQKYNPGYNPADDEYLNDDIISNMQYILYAIKDANNITPCIGAGEENDFNLKILGYMINERSYFTTLLK